MGEGTRAPGYSTDIQRTKWSAILKLRKYYIVYFLEEVYELITRNYILSIILKKIYHIKDIHIFICLYSKNFYLSMRYTNISSCHVVFVYA